MTDAVSARRPPAAASPTRSRRFRRWLRAAFIVWGVTSTLWMFNSMRTQGVDAAILKSSEGVRVVDGAATLEFLPTRAAERAGLIFFCGAGVGASAYAPLVRPIADAGYRVVIVRLPYRLAPLAGHSVEALARARRAIDSHPDTPRWVVAGHSFGAVLAARMAASDPAKLASLMLIGTTHPKEQDLSTLAMPVTKVYASNDGVAPADRVLANAPLLPAGTKWVNVEGGNHSQFGHYGHQLFDGTATMTREQQQALTRAELLEALARAGR
jgi:dienelactone hydrolase